VNEGREKKEGKSWDRRRFLQTAAAGAGPVLWGLSRKGWSRPGPIPARVTVERDELHPLPLTQYGHFIEHLGKCIKEGVWAEGEGPDLFLGGVRPALIAAMRSIHPPLIRYPGGCFADGYHWEDGVGPRSERPRRWNRAWGKFGPLVGPVEDNHFGTDEFCQLCEAVGAEPMLTANVGSGTAEEAAAWEEYVNGGADTPGGRRRAANGHPEPYRVKYWFIGNEIFGWHEIGFQTPAQYVGTLHDYARAMRAKDPDLKLIAVGGALPGGPLADANRVVLEGAGGIIDYLSIHQYVPVMNSARVLRYQVGRMETSDSEAIYYDVIGTLEHMQNFVEFNCRELRTYTPAGRKVQITFDEWNLWFNFLEDIIYNNYNLRDGVWAASMLNLFHRHAPDMPIANIAQMVNCLGIITSLKEGTFLTPTALAFKLYTEHAGEALLRSTVDCPLLENGVGLSTLDLSATRAGDRLALFLVNRHYREEVDTAIHLKGFAAAPQARRYEIYHPNAAQYNTHLAPEAVRIEEREEVLPVREEAGSSLFSTRVLPHSIVCLELKTREA
jgi:alpha-N-arabinofuranosidase